MPTACRIPRETLFLKVLEEPPADVVFILTTSRRGAIMPTILSRVRTYAFIERPAAAQDEVIARVFHDKPEAKESLEAYFYRFLLVPMGTIAEVADSFSLVDFDKRDRRGPTSARGA